MVTLTEPTPILRFDAQTQTLELAGAWHLDAFDAVRWQAQLPERLTDLTIDASGVSHWDSSLMLLLQQIERYAAQQGVTPHFILPKGVEALRGLSHTPASVKPSSTPPRAHALSPVIGLSREVGDELQHLLEFIGSLSRALLQLLRGRATTRWRDVLYFLREVGSEGLPIIGISAILVGMIIGYLGAVQLKTFGAGIYVADLVTIGMLREMGALMTAIIVAGRTGAAYAAQLGTMRTNDEIDALMLLGISVPEFLVVPRVLALMITLPLLVIYANTLGIVGGAIVAAGLDISPRQYFSEVGTALTLAHGLIGVIKAGIFSVLIAIAGCRAGLKADRSSAGVGQAATEAVVVALMYLIIADAAVNIVCQVLDI